MFTNFNLTSKMEFCRCHGVLTEKLNGCSLPRKRSRCDASLHSCASGLETCEGAEPRDGAGGQRARWRAASPRSGPTRPIVARHEGVRTQRPVRAALTGFFPIIRWFKLARKVVVIHATIFILSVPKYKTFCFVQSQSSLSLIKYTEKNIKI